MIGADSIRRSGTSHLLLIGCVGLALLGIFVPRAAAAQYTVVDLGPEGTASGPSFEGQVIGISPSGNQVATYCGAWEAGTYVHADECRIGGVNSSDEVVGSTGQAVSESPVGAPDDDFLAGPIVNEDHFQNSESSGDSVDDTGEIGGLVTNQTNNTTTEYAYIFDPNAASGSQVTLIPNSYDVFGLWPGWAETKSGSLVAGISATFDYYLALDNRTTGGAPVVTNLAPSGQPGGGTAPGDSLASDGTLVGDQYVSCGSSCVGGQTVMPVPTMRLADGTETVLSTTGYGGGYVESVNASHYSVGEVQNTSPGVAALWSPTGAVQDLNSLIPSGSGWDLQNAVAISDDGTIAGWGTLNGTAENFLLTTASSLPTSTTGACVPPTVAPGATTTCTFTVADTTPGQTRTPTGTVTVSSDAPGALAPASDCTLAAGTTAGQATCGLTYTPTEVGTPMLTGTYSGDGQHGSSHGAVMVTVAPAGSTPSSTHTKLTTPKVSGASASAAASCTGPAGSSCTVTVTLTVVETLTGHTVTGVAASAKRSKKAKVTKRTVVLGRITVTIAAGQTKTVKVGLNTLGKRLLTARHTLSVKLTAAEKAGASSTYTVKFKALAKKPKRR